MNDHPLKSVIANRVATLITIISLTTLPNAFGQIVDNINPINLPQEQAFVTDYLGEGAGASALLGFFYLDIDTDKDGIPDFSETGPGDDLDGDGLINSADPDDDNDGILDAADTEPAGITSMPDTYFTNGATASANGSTAGDYWQFLPNSTIAAGTYAGYFEHPGVYLYIDNNANEIPDVLEYTTGNMAPFPVEKDFTATHIIDGAYNGLLGAWEYGGSPGTTAAERTHITGRTIYYICDDDGGTATTGAYAGSPYSGTYTDIYGSTNSDVDYNIYNTTSTTSLNIPQPVLGTDLVGDDYFHYRWFDDIIVSPNREIVLFTAVFWSSGGSTVNTYYSRTEFNSDNTPASPNPNGNTTGDGYGGGTTTNWYPSYQNTADHDALAADVFGGGTTWAMIASAPTGGASPVAVNPANQAWVDMYENWTPDRRIVQYRAVEDHMNATAAGVNTVINNRYSYDLTADGQHIIIRAKNGKCPHFMVLNPVGDPNSFIVGVEDLYGGGDRDYEDEIFYITFFDDVALSVTKTDSFTVNNCSDTITYKVVIKNSGNTTATTVTFDDTPDANTTLVAGSVTTTVGTVTIGNTGGDTDVQVSVGSLAIGDSVVICFNADVNAGVFPGITTASNQGTVSGGNFADILTSDPDATDYYTTTTTDLTVLIDSTAPVITCPADQNVSFDATCQYTLLDYTGLATATDNCASPPTVTQSPAAGTVITTTTTITLTADDGSGNTTDCTFDVIPADNTAPSITCPGDQNVSFDASCQYTLLDYTGMATAADNCTASPTVTQSPAAGTIVSATTTITLTADDGNGNTTDCTFDVIPADNTPPTITCPGDQNVSLDATCQYTLLDYTGMATAADNCSVTVTQAPAAGTVITATTTVTLTATDGNGNTATCTFDVIPADNTPPSITCPGDQNVSFDAACQYTLLDYTGMATASDNCSVTVTQAPAAGTIITTTTTITLTATDGNGNTTDCTFDVIPADNTPPTITCPGDQNVNFDASCQYTLLDYTGLATAMDNCSATITQAPAAGTIITTTTTITLTATDGNGNSVDCTFDVIPADNTPPTITCPGDQNVSLDATCQYTLLDYTGMATAADNCSVTVTQAPAAGTIITATTTITLTATDGNGNTASCTFDVIPADNTPPTITCPGDQNVNFDAACQYTLLDYTGMATAADNCSVTVTQAPAAGTIITATTTITLTATDGNGNTTDCTFDVIPTDNTPPTITCPVDQNVSFDGTCQYTLLDYTGLATAADNCTASPTITQSPAIGTLITGTTTITLTADDGNGNTTDCTFDVIPTDDAAPTIACPADQNVSLDATCQYTLLDYTGLATAGDNCASLPIITQSPAAGTVITATTTITLTADDGNGNTTDCTFDVIPTDNTLPVVICQDIDLYLDATGNASITSADIDGGSSDECGIASIVPSMTAFTCAEVGANNVTLVVTDNNGNIDSCTAIVTVMDTIRPTVICQDIDAYLNETGNAVITAADVDNGSADACGIATMVISETTFDCTFTGPNNVTLTVTDANGNIDSCMAIVNVIDTVNSVVVCQDIDVYLDAAGNASITALDIDGGSTDACGIADLSTPITDFTCADVGANDLTLYVTDNSGNVDSCTAVVTIIDTIIPNVICQDITVYLDGTGSITIAPADIDGGSSDACGIASMTASETTFTCAETGINEVTLTVMDNNGNIDSCLAEVTVLDSLAPNVNCLDITVYLDETGNVSITEADIDDGSTDECGIVSLVASITDFTCADAGDNNVTLVATDNSGNVDSCIAVVTVMDTLAPNVMCRDINVYLDGAGNAVIGPFDIDDGSFDECGVATMSASKTSFTCLEIGDHDVTLYVMDSNGNIDSCTAVVTAHDTLNPIVLCQDITLYLDEDGEASIIPDDIDAGSSDNCGIAILTASKTSFNCANTGTNNVTLTALDVNGNIDSCIAVVTVLDTITPVLICGPDKIESMNEDCVFIVPNYADSVTVSDNCTSFGFMTFTQTPAVGETLEGLGSDHTITLTAADASGNSTTCSFVITIMDNTAPAIACPGDQVIDTDYSCVYEIPDYRDLAIIEMDNCDLDNFTVTQYPAPGTMVTADNSSGLPTEGFTVVTIVTEDLSGNKDSCTFIVDVTCIDDLNIPQLLSPNSDGKNDVLIIDGLERYPENEIVIFNRWGNVVYEASPYQNDWNGEPKSSLYGDQLPDGSYFYKFRVSPESDPITGYIIIKR